YALDRAPHGDGGAPRGHLPARLRSAGSARRVQARGPRLLRADARANRRRRRADDHARVGPHRRAGRAGRAGRAAEEHDVHERQWQERDRTHRPPHEPRRARRQWPDDADRRPAEARSQRSVLVRLREEVQEVSRPLAAVLILGAVVSCARGSDGVGDPSTSVPTLSPIAAVAASAGPGILDDRFGYVVGERELKVRSETSDAAITAFVPQGRSWTSLSRTVAPDGRSIAYWAPVNDGAVLHVRSAATGADRAVFSAASDMSGNTFAWSSDGTGLVIAIDNNCQEICAFQGGPPRQD